MQQFESRENMAAITVFTPTYNRAYCLHRCYESLCRQSCKDFVWLIIDDGSTDQTKDIVEGWQRAENGFEIVYLYKENGGMHTGYNCAYARIDTERHRRAAGLLEGTSKRGHWRDLCTGPL